MKIYTYTEDGDIMEEEATEIVEDNDDVFEWKGKDGGTNTFYKQNANDVQKRDRSYLIIY